MNARLIMVKLVMLSKSMAIPGCAPQVGCAEEKKEYFRSELEEVVREAGNLGYVVLRAGLNVSPDTHLSTSMEALGMVKKRGR